MRPGGLHAAYDDDAHGCERRHGAGLRVDGAGGRGGGAAAVLLPDARQRAHLTASNGAKHRGREDEDQRDDRERETRAADGRERGYSYT